MQACRTCLKVLSNEMEFMTMDAEECDTNLPSVRSKLLTCVPELALDVIQSAVICCTCFQALNVAYNFRNTCLRTEDKILSYKQCNGANSVNMIDVVHQAENFDGEDIKPIINGESTLLQPQITLTEGSNDIQKPLNLPYSSEFDVEVKLYSPHDGNIQIGEFPLHRPCISVHNEVKPFCCTECHKSFVRKDKLMLHMRIHTGEKPFKCTYCGRSFSRKDKMNNHERTHTGEKPFQCIICQKSFSRKDRMNAHMRLHHPHAMANLDIAVTDKGNDKAMQGSTSLTNRLVIYNAASMGSGY